MLYRAADGGFMPASACGSVYGYVRSGLCDMGPALEKMVAQALRESGRDEDDAKQLTGVALYGILMMARKGDMTLESAMNMISEVIGLNKPAA